MLSDPKRTLYDVFISYGRKESLQFATRLCEALTNMGLQVWMDMRNLPPGIDWQQTIDEGIIRSKTILYIIAPHAVSSPYCEKEVELSLFYQKKILPVLHIKKDIHRLNERLAEINWFPLEEKYDPTLPPDQWEAINPFDEGVESLYAKIKENEAFNSFHTELLIRAKEWEKNQFGSSFGLQGSFLHIALEWLRKSWEADDPSQQPAKLVCELIVESKKAAELGDSDVFFGYARTDQAVQGHIADTLHLAGISTWSDLRDIKPGVDYFEAIHEGILHATHFVFLISPESIISANCLKELELAVSLGKSIIPVMVQAVPEAELPESIRFVQHIDLTDNDPNRKKVAKNERSDFQKDTAALIARIEDDQTYYQTHKSLLVLASLWEKSSRSDSFLLRGEALNQLLAAGWLAKGHARSRQKPLPLHKEFLEASTAQANDKHSDVYLSYAEGDSDFANKLCRELQGSYKTVWAEYHQGHPMAQENEWLALADHMVFVLSEASIHASRCQQDLATAARLGKRIIVVYTQEPQSPLPEVLDNCPMIHFGLARFELAFSNLMHALLSDPGHVRRHTELQQLANFWKKKQGKGKTVQLALLYATFQPSHLLSRQEYHLYRIWAQETDQQKKVPSPTALQREFLEATRQFQHAKILVWGLLATVLLSIFPIYATYKLRQNEAEKQSAKEKTALNFAFAARELLENEQALDRAIALFKEAVNMMEADSSILKLLPVANQIQQSIAANKLSFPFDFEDLKIGDNDTSSFVATKDQTRLRIYDLLGNDRLTKDFEAPIRLVRFTPLPNTVLVLLEKKSPILFNYATQELSLVPESISANDGVKVFQFDPENRRMYVQFDNRSSVFRWDIGKKEREFYYNLPGAIGGTVTHMTLSPNREDLVIVSSKGNLRLWDMNAESLNSNTLADFPQNERKSIQKIQFDLTGRWLMANYADKTLEIWEIINHQPVKKLIVGGTQGNAQSLQVEEAFWVPSAEGRPPLLLYRRTDGRAFIQDFGQVFIRELATYRQNMAGITDIIYSIGRSKIVTSSKNGIAVVWGINGDIIGQEIDLREDLEAKQSLELSPDEKHLIKIGKKGGITIWNIASEKTPIKPYKVLIGSGVKRFSFTNDRHFLVVDEAGALTKWKMEPQMLNIDTIGANNGEVLSQKQKMNLWLKQIDPNDLKLSVKEKIRFGLGENFNTVKNYTDSASLAAYAAHYQEEGRKSVKIDTVKLGDALSLYQKLDSLYPSLATALNINDLKLSLGKPLDPKSLVGSRQLKAEEKLQMAQYLRQTWEGFPDEERKIALENAVTLYLEVLEDTSYQNRQSESPFIKKKISNLQNSLAWLYLKNKANSQAIETAKDGLKMDPSYEWINTKLALAYLYNEDVELALPIIQKMKDAWFGADSYQEKMRDYLKDMELIYQKTDSSWRIQDLINESVKKGHITPTDRDFLFQFFGLQAK